MDISTLKRANDLHKAILSVKEQIAFLESNHSNKIEFMLPPISIGFLDSKIKFCHAADIYYTLLIVDRKETLAALEKEYLELRPLSNTAKDEH
jgi:hypothetical protein